MAVSISLSIKQNSQSIANNTSNVTVAVIAKWTYGSYNKLDKAGTLTIDGTKYSFTSPFNEGQSTSGSETIYSKTVNVSHASNGTKTLSCSATYVSGVSSGTVTASTSKVLTTIPRASSLTAGNGTLGTAQTLTISRADSSFKHKISYTCGSVSGYAAGSSSAYTTATSISWTPPLSLASQNTSGTSVSITLYLKTYTSGGTQIGSVTKTISCAIPASVKPTCTVAVTDPTGYATTYGSYLKGLSKFKVVVTPTTSYGSAIASYHTTANGATYTAASFTTGVLKSSGTLTVSATVKDKRGRSGSVSVTRSVIDYTAPLVDELNVTRCDEDGTENAQGGYAKVAFSATVTSLNSKNTATYTLSYKKSTETEYTDVVIEELANVYSVTDQIFIFEADSGSSYDIALNIQDAFSTTGRTTSVSTGFVLMHWKADGTGMAVGKISELSNIFDMGLQAKFSSGIQNEVLEKISDLNAVFVPNIYVSVNQGATSYTNCPIASGTFVLEVMSAGAEGQVFQRLTSTFKGTHETYERHYYQSSWGDWVKVRSDTGWLNLTLQSGISVGSEAGYLKGRLKNGVLYIKGDVTGISANWKNFAQLPSALIVDDLPTATRFSGIYNVSYFCGLNLTSAGALYTTLNDTGAWDSTKNVSINVAICI